MEAGTDLDVNASAAIGEVTSGETITGVEDTITGTASMDTAVIINNVHGDGIETGRTIIGVHGDRSDAAEGGKLSSTADCGH